MFQCVLSTLLMWNQFYQLSIKPTKRKVIQEILIGLKNVLSLQERDVNGNGITIVSDSEGQDSEGQNSHRASGGHSVSHSFTRSGKCDTGRKMKSTEMDSSKCHKGVQTDTPKPQDCDEYYFMTLTKVFKKLAPQKKAGVRMKIEHLLLEAQFT